MRAYPPAAAVCARDLKARMLHSAPAAAHHPNFSACNHSPVAGDDTRRQHCLAPVTCSASTRTAAAACKPPGRECTRARAYTLFTQRLDSGEEPTCLACQIELSAPLPSLQHSSRCPPVRPGAH